MKIRNDFVSNSSSCSFIIAVNHKKHFPFTDFVQKLLDDCVNAKDCDDNDSVIETTTAVNRRNLNYHLKTSELLFIGKMKTLRQLVINKFETPTMFEEIENEIKSNNLTSNEKLIEQTDEVIKLEYPQYYGYVTIPQSRMNSVLGHWSRCNSDKPEVLADTLIEFLGKLSDDHDYTFNSHLFFVSKNSVRNTKVLIDAGYEIVLPKWAEDLDAIEKRLDDGDSIYGICQNQGGEGMDDFSIYALGEWDAIINEDCRIEILNSELG